MPARTASSTTYWMAGLSTTGSISLGWALVAGRKRVPSPAAGMTALVTDPCDIASSGRRPSGAGHGGRRTRPAHGSPSSTDGRLARRRGRSACWTDPRHCCDRSMLALARRVATGRADHARPTTETPPRCPPTSTAARTAATSSRPSQSFTDDATHGVPDVRRHRRRSASATSASASRAAASTRPTPAARRPRRLLVGLVDVRLVGLVRPARRRLVELRLELVSSSDSGSSELLGLVRSSTRLVDVERLGVLGSATPASTWSRGDRRRRA